MSDQRKEDQQKVPHLDLLSEQLTKKQIDRREFVRFATLLGLAAPSAYAMVGTLTGEAFAPPAKAQALPKGGVLRIGSRLKDIKSPHTYSWGGYDSNIARQVVEYLTFTDVNGATSGTLFESWTVTPDLKTWTFKVRQGVKWSNGETLTADHILWNLNRMLDAKVGSSMIGLMKGYLLNEKPGENGGKPTTELWSANAIEKVDAATIRFNCKAPQVAVPEHLFHYPAAILHPSENGVFGPNSIGTGAFTLTEFDVGKKAVFKRRAGYWGGDAALDGIEFIDVGDDASAPIAALASKQLHGLYQGDPSQYEALKALPHLEFYTAKTGTTGAMRMRPEAKPFDDKRVRQAMRYAVDGEAVLKVALRGLGTLGAHTHVSEAQPDAGGLPPIKRDVAKAKALLAEAGYKDGIKSEIVVPNDHPWFLPMAETCQQQWKEAGIDISIKPIPGAQYWDIWTKVPFSTTIWFHRPLAVMTMGLAYRTGVPWNESGWSNKEFDEVLLKAEGELDVGKRKAYIKRLEEIMQDDGPLVQPVFLNVFTFMDKKVKGFSYHPTQYIFGSKIGLEA